MRSILVGLTVALLGFGLVAQADEPGRRSGNCPGIDLLVSQGWPANGVGHYYYGGVEWDDLSAAIDDSAASVTLTNDLSDLPTLLQYDAIWIDQRDNDTGPGPGELSPAEESAVAAFIATGRRVVMIGENQNWADWNDQILGLVGGTFDGEVFPTRLLPVSDNELTWGVAYWNVGSPGKCFGGVRLFDENAVTLWKLSALTILEVNGLSDAYAADPNNRRLIDNVAAWIGCHRGLFADDLEGGDTSRWSATVP